MSDDNTSNTEKPTKKSILIGLSLVIPFSMVVYLMIAAGSGQVAVPPENAKIHKVQVQMIEPQNSHLQQRLVFGRVESSNRADLGFELSGKVTEMLVDEGDVVSAGQLLGKLDTARLDASMRELTATLARTQADLRLAKLSEQRTTELVRKKLESNQRLDEAVETSAAAEAVVDEILAKKLTLQVELDKSWLYANSDAIVLARPVDAETVVAAGQPVLTVQQSNAFEVRLGLAQNQAFAMTRGQKHDLIFANTTLQGTIKSIANQRTQNTRTVDVIFNLEIADSISLIPGDLVSFKYTEKVDEAGVWVPKQSLSTGIRGLWNVFVVADVGQQKLVSKSAEILYSEDDKSFVQGPFNRGDLIVINGTQRLVPGQKVDAIASVLSIVGKL